MAGHVGEVHDRYTEEVTGGRHEEGNAEGEEALDNGSVGWPTGDHLWADQVDLGNSRQFTEIPERHREKKSAEGPGENTKEVCEQAGRTAEGATEGEHY